MHNYSQDPINAVQIVFRPMLVSGTIARHEDGSIVILIDNEQPKPQQVKALFHELLHLALMSAKGTRPPHDEDWVERNAQMIAEACPDILKEMGL